MHNTMVAVGPDFRSGFFDELPSGNTDVAPTIAWILGVEAPNPMDGRVLNEALVSFLEAPGHVEERTLRASHQSNTSRWDQYLKISEAGSVIYIEEGNGHVSRK